MSRRLERMRANPAGDWTIADIQALCWEHTLRPAKRWFALQGVTSFAP